MDTKLDKKESLSLDELITRLKEESYVQMKGLDKLPISELGEKLQNNWDELATETEDESFLRSRELYCEIIFALEAGGQQALTERSLSELPLEAPVEMAPEETGADDFMPEIPTNSESAEVDLDSITMDFEMPPSSDLKAASPSLPIVEESSIKDEVPEPLAPPPLNNEEPKEEEKASFAEPPALPNPDEIAPEIATEPVKLAKENDLTPGPNFLAETPEAHDFLALATRIATLASETTSSQLLIERVRGISICFAIESDCLAKTRQFLAPFFESRDQIVRLLKKNDSEKFELDPKLLMALDQLGRNHSDWLYKKRFPFHQVVAALNYLVTVPASEKYTPTLIEAAQLMFFFGQNSSLEGFPFKNVIGLSGLTSDEILEMSFRLTRVQLFKNKLVSASSDISTDLTDALQEDSLRLFELMQKIVLDAPLAQAS